MPAEFHFLVLMAIDVHRNFFFLLLFRSTSSDDDIIVARFQDGCITGYPRRQKQFNDCCVIVCIIFLQSFKIFLEAFAFRN